MGSSLNWRGPEISAKVKAASKVGVDATTAACVTHAKSNHPWKNETGTLEGSLQMRPAEESGESVRGEWGSFDVLYAIFQELGTVHMAANPYLRPAADAEYPNLAGRIKAAM
jgi:HK97 gp10 family phage protein